jgi:hypothetical protein
MHVRVDRVEFLPVDWTCEVDWFREERLTQTRSFKNEDSGRPSVGDSRGCVLNLKLTSE